MIVSRLSATSQTTLPREVLEALGLKPGDAFAYVIGDDGTVRLRSVEAAKADPFDSAFAAFTEWADPVDREDFDDL